MPFFDFHIHPVLKCLFSEDVPGTDQKKLSPWVPIDKDHIPFLLRWCTDFQYILCSQGNLAQLCSNDCNFVCVALYIPEKDMLTDPLLANGANGPLGVYLQPAKLQQLINCNPYQTLETEDWTTLTDAARFGILGKQVKPLTKSSDYNQADANTIHTVFSVEGCHTLSSKLQYFDVNEVLANLDDLRGKVRVLSLNLTHMEFSPFCNQAYGMQFLNNEGFKPIGKGIAADGMTIVQHCYTNKIMIDIKHMSLAARQDLYSARSTPAFAAINQPVICTHAGFTGISVTEIPDYVFKKEGFAGENYTELWQGKPVKYGANLRPSFNASSINLYDEDIIQVLQSGGMIGLSLDKRILGFQDYDDSNARDQYPLETEYISNDEASFFFGNPAATLGSAFDDGLCLGWDDIENGGAVNPALAAYHLTYFMAHVLHVIVVAQNNGYDAGKALTQVCIGADFDGLINPVWCCPTADGLAQMQQMFEAAFIGFAHDSNVALPAGFDVHDFSSKLFFENGKNFALGRLDVLNS